VKKTLLFAFAVISAVQVHAAENIVKHIRCQVPLSMGGVHYSSIGLPKWQRSYIKMVPVSREKFLVIESSLGVNINGYERTLQVEGLYHHIKRPGLELEYAQLIPTNDGFITRLEINFLQADESSVETADGQSLPLDCTIPE
jgi:hypothetical protein